MTETEKTKQTNIAKRLGVFVFEVFAVLVAITVVALIVLGLRLQEKPLQVDSLTPVIEEMLNRNEAGLRFSIGQTALKWENFRRPASIVVAGINVRNVHNLDVATVKELGVSFSIAHLLVGKLRPVRFSVIEPDIFFYRDIEGNITVDLAAAPHIKQAVTEEKKPLPVEEIEKSRAGRDVLLSVIDGFINPESKTSLIGELEEMEIVNAKLLFADLKNQQFWDMPTANFLILRTMRGLEAKTDISVRHDLGDFNITGQIRHGYDFDETTEHHQRKRRTIADLKIDRMNTDLLISNIPALEPLTGSKAFLSLDVSLSFTDGFQADIMRALMRAEDGVVTLRDVTEKPIDFEDLTIDLMYDQHHQRLISERISLKTGRIELQGDLDIDMSGDVPQAVIKGSLKDLQTSDLARYWPMGAADNAREWVLAHIRDGEVEGATIEMVLNLPRAYHLQKKDDPAAAEIEGTDDFEIVSVQGAFNYKDLTIDYLAPLPPAEKVQGSVQFDDKKFTFDVLGGQVGGLNFGRSQVILAGLDIGEETAEIDIKGLNGDLQKLAQILDQEPLGFLSVVDLKPAGFSGTFRGDVSLSFPLLADLLIEDVKVSAAGTAKAEKIDNLFRSHALTNGDLEFTLDDETLSFSGQASILGGRLDELEWTYNLQSKNPIETTLEAKGQVTNTDETLRLLDIPLDEYLKQTAYVNLNLEERRNGQFSGRVNLDFQATEIDIPYINFRKERGIGAKGSFTFNGRKGRLEKISKIRLSGKDLDISGDLEFIAKGDDIAVAKAVFPTVKTTENNLSITASLEQASTYNLVIEGRRYDARYFLQRDKTELVDEAEKAVKDGGTALRIKIGMHEIVAMEGAILRNAAALIVQDNNGELMQFDMDGDTDKGQINVRYRDVGGKESFRVRSNDAGNALRALGISDNFLGGRLYIVAETGASPEHPKRLAGDFLLRDFKLVKAPTLARIINALSLDGLGELLRPGSSGMDFERLGTQFIWRSTSKSKILEVMNTKTRGASLGLTFDGRINLTNDTVNGRGTIVPVSDLNHMLGRIPILGQIITGGRGDAVFAATYTVKGGLDEPDVQVNPLAALAPGFLRRLFFERDPTDRDEEFFPEIKD